jgi:cob(I)alamin adenosyltransferase
MNGLIHVYCGDGKGKTTCATGLCIRAVGAGKKVLICRLLKNENSSELEVLRKIEGIEVMPTGKDFGFFHKMSDEQKQEAKEAYTKQVADAISKVRTESVQVLFLDEIMAAYNLEMIDRELLLEFLRNKPEQLEVILTGRDPAKEILDLADYVSDIRKVKHPYDRNIMARRGIEY